MELPATVAAWDGDQLTVWDKVQGIVYRQQAVQPRRSAFPADNIRVISPFVGGAFGSAGRPGRTNCSPRSPPGSCVARSSWC